VLQIKGAHGLTINGHGATLVCHDFATLFLIVDCTDLSIRNLKIDYDPLPFTAGQVISEGEGYVDLKIEPHHPVQSGFRAESLLPYDPVRHRMGVATEDLYQPNRQERTKQIAPDVLRVPVTKKMYHAGDWVILRHQIYSKNAFDLRDCVRVTFNNVTVYTCPGMALHAQGGADYLVAAFNVMVKPGSGRWFTATADATHFNGVRGHVTLDRCDLESMGDDGANIHNWYLRVTQVIDPRTFKCELGKDPSWEPPLPQSGDELEIGRMPNPLMPAFTAKVESAKLDEGGKLAIVRLDQAHPVQVDDVVGDASALPSAIDIRRCTVRANRARGVLIQGRHATVEQCTFEDISGAAIQVTSDVQRWWEGMPARDVTIKDNTIARVNFSLAARAAAIDVFADVGKSPAPDPVARGIVIENNTIKDSGGKAAIHIGSAEDVVIRGNTFDVPFDNSVEMDHSRNVHIER
jgi:hypothetical protein